MNINANKFVYKGSQTSTGCIHKHPRVHVTIHHIMGNLAGLCMDVLLDFVAGDHFVHSTGFGYTAYRQVLKTRTEHGEPQLLEVHALKLGAPSGSKLFCPVFTLVSTASTRGPLRRRSESDQAPGDGGIRAPKPRWS